MEWKTLFVHGNFIRLQNLMGICGYKGAYMSDHEYIWVNRGITYMGMCGYTLYTTGHTWVYYGHTRVYMGIQGFSVCMNICLNSQKINTLQQGIHKIPTKF